LFNLEEDLPLIDPLINEDPTTD